MPDELHSWVDRVKCTGSESAESTFYLDHSVMTGAGKWTQRWFRTFLYKNKAKLGAKGQS